MSEKKIDGVLVRQIPSWERYWVANYGPVWADPLDYFRLGKPKVSPGRWLSFKIIEKGRRCVTLIGKDGRKSFPVAHLVALAWIGLKPEGLLVLHRDDNQTNDYYTNLYYGTHEDNTKDCINNGCLNPREGVNHWTTSLSEDQVKEIYLRANAGENQRELAKEFHVTKNVIFNIKKKITWRSVTQDL